VIRDSVFPQHVNSDLIPFLNGRNNFCVYIFFERSHTSVYGTLHPNECCLGGVCTGGA
jgi:hypothetical protein